MHRLRLALGPATSHQLSVSSTSSELSSQTAGSATTRVWGEMLASSSRREAAGATEKSRQAKKVGCMSGIFYFLHFHRHNSRKRLTSPGERDAKTSVSLSPAPAPAPHIKPKTAVASEAGQKILHKKRAARQQGCSPSAKPPGDKTSTSKRSAPHEATSPAAAAETGAKTTRDKRAAPSNQVGTRGVDIAAKCGEKISQNKRAAGAEVAPASPVPVCSPGGALSRRLSCDVPRSPTLPSEIRRSDYAGNAVTKPPALVARLMGLDDPPAPPVDTPESAAEKRRKLLGALERCDEDLRTLKNIIDALRIAESRKVLTAAGLVPADRRGIPATPKRYDSSAAATEPGDKRSLDVDSEQPSPVSVLDALSSPPARRRSTNRSGAPEKGVDPIYTAGNQRGDEAAASEVFQPVQQQHLCPPSFAPSPPPPDGRHDREVTRVDGQNTPLLRRISAHFEVAPSGATAAGRRAERSFLDHYHLEPWQRMAAGTTIHPHRRPPCSRALEESVDQVWMDGALEERWELGRVGVALEVDILGDLVAEVIKGLGLRRHSSRPQIPFDACRKRLSY